MTQIKIIHIIVIKIEVKMLEVFADSMWRKKFTIDCDNLKIVSRHVKAIVNPRVNVISIHNWRLNSFLNFVPGKKGLLFFFSFLD